MTNKIDISKGRYWDRPWSLVSSCDRVSPGCLNCWALAMEKRFHKEGPVTVHPDRLSIPLKTKRPTVWAVWNDLYHKDVPIEFRHEVYAHMIAWTRHTFLVLTKRPQTMADYLLSEIPLIKSEGMPRCQDLMDNVWHGLTVCNQQEANEKIPVFLKVPGRKFLSIEPMLGPIDLHTLTGRHEDHPEINSRIFERQIDGISAVLCGGETGPGARPTHPDWIRSIRDQCAESGTPFFFKQWGEFVPLDMVKQEDRPRRRFYVSPGGQFPWMFKVGRKKAGRAMDGTTYDSLPWMPK